MTTIYPRKPVRDHLAHDVGQRLFAERRNLHPAHSLRRPRTLRNVGGVDHKLQRKMRKDMGDDAGLAMPARDAVHQRRLLQRRLVVLRGKPVRARHFGHAAKQPFLGAAAEQQPIAAPHHERGTAAQRAGLLWRLARISLLIAAHAADTIGVQRTQGAGRFLRGADRGAQSISACALSPARTPRRRREAPHRPLVGPSNVAANC